MRELGTPAREPATIAMAATDEDLARCFLVMRQLRPHLGEEGFVGRVRRQEAGGYRLAYLEADGAVQAVAGYRVFDNLVSGPVLYVDDLVTDAGGRSRGSGAALLDWLAARAREAGCQCLELYSGVQRFDAHRFYVRHRMAIVADHFRLPLEA